MVDTVEAAEESVQSLLNKVNELAGAWSEDLAIL